MSHRFSATRERAHIPSGAKDVGGEEDLAVAVRNVIERSLAIGEGEEVLVIADPGTKSIGNAVQRAATAAGGDAILALMDARVADGTEPPAALAAAMARCDVYVAATTRSLSHTTARAEATNLGVRGATMPGVTADMLARVMAVDLDALASRTRAIATMLSAASNAELSCPRGSSMVFDLTGRTAIADDGDLTGPGAFGNLPCGEAFIAPRGGDGQVVAASLASVGLSDPAAVLSIEHGRLVGAKHGHGPIFLERLRDYGELGLNLAELGIGTNDRATLTGHTLEDEKIMGSVHVAFGASLDFGGSITVPIHLDAVIPDATLSIDGHPVLEAGRIVSDIP